MQQRTTTLLAEQAGLLSMHADALFPVDAGSLVATLMASSDDDLLRLHSHAVDVLKLAESAVIAVSGEVARRSEAVLPDPLARRLGQKNAGALLASRSALTEAESSAHAKLGLALTPREGLTGETLPPFFPVIAEALAAGSVTARAARLIVDALHKVEPHVSADRLASLERAIVNGAVNEWSALLLADVCRTLPDRIDPDGIAPREAAIRARRGARRRLLDDGTVQWILNFDPEAAAYFEAAMDARTAPRRQVRFVDVDDSDALDTSDEDGLPADPVDSRTLEQKRLDAVTDIARDSLRHDDGAIGGVDTTAVIHIPLEALTSGGAGAWFEGIETTVSAATARRAIACAEIISLVLDGEGQPMKLGSTHRYFTAGQRRAMACARQGLSLARVHRTSSLVRRRPHRSMGQVEENRHQQRLPPLPLPPPKIRRRRLDLPPRLEGRAMVHSAAAR